MGWLQERQKKKTISTGRNSAKIRQDHLIKQKKPYEYPFPQPLFFENFLLKLSKPYKQSDEFATFEAKKKHF